MLRGGHYEPTQVIQGRPVIGWCTPEVDTGANIISHLH